MDRYFPTSILYSDETPLDAYFQYRYIVRINQCASGAAMPIQQTHTRMIKRAINLSLTSDVLDAAKALNINVSMVCDTYLREYVRQEQERRWRSEHADFIETYNQTIESEGLPLDAWRTF
jgi:antitoxin CcdA